jgi:hypothetical protein
MKNGEPGRNRARWRDRRERRVPSGDPAVPRAGLPAEARDGVADVRRRGGVLDAAMAYSLRVRLRAKAGEPGRNRTFNQQIKSLLLCQLSYGPTMRIAVRILTRGVNVGYGLLVVLSPISTVARLATNNRER